MSKPVLRRKKDGGDGDEEESELLQNSSEDEGDEDGELVSVSSSQPVKPLVTDRYVCPSGHRSVTGQSRGSRFTRGLVLTCTGCPS